MKLVVVVFCVLNVASQAMTTNHTSIKERNKIIMAYLLPWTGTWATGMSMGPAILPALDAIKEQGLLPGYDIELLWRDTSCDQLQGMKMAVDIWKINRDIDVIIGDGCSTVCNPLALLASAWNVPMVSWGCNAISLSDKYVYPTFSRVTGSIMYLQRMYLLLIEAFGWNRIGLLTDTSDVYRLFSQQLLSLLRSHHIVTFYYQIQPTVDGGRVNHFALAQLRNTLKSLKNNVRIIFTFVYGYDFNNIMLAARDENMLDGGYVFMTSETYDPFAPDAVFQEGTLIRSTAYVSTNESWHHFATEIIKSFDNPTFQGMPRLSRDAAVNEVSSYAGLVYDAAFLWALGANKTLEQGYSLYDGFKVNENIINMTFEGMTGTLKIDQYGDRKQDNLIYMIQNHSLVPLMEFIASDGLLKKIYKAEDPNDWSGLLWPGRMTSVPSDSPPCGWEDELCVDEKKNFTVIIVCVVSVVALVVVTGITVGFRKIRHTRLELLFCSAGSGAKKLACLSQASIETGKVKNVTVAIKRLGSGSLSISDRSVLVELKIMKDLEHENINAFVGVCLEQPHACILMTYAPRGSLYDVIQDNNIKLTWDFKLSLVADVAQGMRFLHGTPIVSHGHLTSSNCVVNSRWSCQITDYGLTHSKQEARRTASEKQLTAWQLQWTAPELLDSCQFGSQGTQKGDVYSFGILTQEVILQDLPFADNLPLSEPEDILKRVKDNEDPPYRPYLYTESCSSVWRDLMVQCWDEDENRRPTFATILTMIQEIAGGKVPSLVDSMIDRLESHTKQLEVIVTERCKELEEEKVKMEVILQDLLPRSVAERLKNGLPIAPESFDNVTIFFSDIVSFTRISAAGTPIDVVKMLNFMYTLFDDIAAVFDVYKVATIGDAYFVASGVPSKNGDRHAVEICNMGLKLMKGIQDCPIPHLPEERLKMRIGIHSGPCVAAVVGTKMPRYLLFGETIDAASNMEANGVSMRIHISAATLRLLDKTECFDIEERGCMDIKGLGKTVTYFIND